MVYNIRKMIKEDCVQVAHIVTESWNETYQGIVPAEFLSNLYTNERERAINYFNRFDEENNHMIVLEIDDKIVGFVNVGKTNEIEFENYGELHAIYLLKEYKNNGFGKLLFNSGINELKSMWYDKLLVGCLDKNPSNEFYIHMGGKFITQRIFKKLNLPENVYLFNIKK